MMSKSKNKHKSIVDILFDPDNKENIVLYNENDDKLEFEQIALIPIGDKVYAILKPTALVEGVADDEALAFEINEKEDSLSLVEDESIIDQIFNEYYKLLED